MLQIKRRRVPVEIGAAGHNGDPGLGEQLGSHRVVGAAQADCGFVVDLTELLPGT